jgi:hypothetical protein
MRSCELDVDDALEAVAHGRVDAAFGLDYPSMPLPRVPGIEIVTSARSGSDWPSHRVPTVCAPRAEGQTRRSGAQMMDIPAPMSVITAPTIIVGPVSMCDSATGTR